jgi:hypothetical protein
MPTSQPSSSRTPPTKSKREKYLICYVDFRPQPYERDYGFVGQNAIAKRGIRLPPASANGGLFGRDFVVNP